MFGDVLPSRITHEPSGQRRKLGGRWYEIAPWQTTLREDIGYDRRQEENERLEDERRLQAYSRRKHIAS